MGNLGRFPRGRHATTGQLGLEQVDDAEDLGEAGVSEPLGDAARDWL